MGMEQRPGTLPKYFLHKRKVYGFHTGSTLFLTVHLPLAQGAIVCGHDQLFVAIVVHLGMPLRSHVNLFSSI